MPKCHFRKKHLIMIDSERQHFYKSLKTGQIKKHREVWRKVLDQMPDYLLAQKEYNYLTELLYKRIGKPGLQGLKIEVVEWPKL